MIKIFDRDGEIIRHINSEENDISHLTPGELLEDFPEADAQRWSFTIFNHRYVVQIYNSLPKEKRRAELVTAYVRDWEVVEICTGDFDNPEWVALAPEVDVRRLKQEWYLSLAKTYGRVIVD